MPKAGFIVARVSFLVLAASMLGVALLAVPAAGQPVTCSSTTKCLFAVNPVAPSNPPAGTNTSFTFTIQNEASPQQLGAVQISAPTGFMITAASIAPGAPGTASSTSSSAVFTNLSVASGSTVTLTVAATVSCGSGSYTWSIAAKQSNNFNGSGNDFQLDPKYAANLSGTATGSCTPSKPCPSTTSCSASASSGTTGDSITVTTSVPVPKTDIVVAGIEDSIGDPSFNYNCPTYPSSRDVFSFAIFDANGVPQPIALTVTVRIDKSVVSKSTHPGASSWQICYASTTPFSANAVSGTYTSSTSTNPPTIGGVAYNTGLLLGCPATKGTLPCVQSQNKNMAGDVLVTFLAPGDPFAHP